MGLVVFGSECFDAFFHFFMGNFPFFDCFRQSDSVFFEGLRFAQLYLGFIVPFFVDFQGLFELVGNKGLSFKEIDVFFEVGNFGFMFDCCLEEFVFQVLNHVFELLILVWELINGLL